MNLRISRLLTLAGLVLAWIAAGCLQGWLTYSSGFMLLLFLQIAFIYLLEAQIQQQHSGRRRRLLETGVGLTGVCGLAAAVFMEVPLWFKLFVLCAQTAFTTTEFRLIRESRLQQKKGTA
ncbi:hypothetical protein [Paenibacillus glufosinatiresistens]|uniref:hypothetical protein n=1 Tax=Paenibacillus glufosinatiresistens TaxID=3070657 RepID=UPI00286E8264|nr:hypothetical protein [Paenibacillus sp. YX.27]